MLWFHSSTVFHDQRGLSTRKTRWCVCWVFSGCGFLVSKQHHGRDGCRSSETHHRCVSPDKRTPDPVQSHAIIPCGDVSGIVVHRNGRPTQEVSSQFDINGSPPVLAHNCCVIACGTFCTTFNIVRDSWILCERPWFSSIGNV